MSSIVKTGKGLAGLAKAVSNDKQYKRAGVQEALVIAIDCSGSMAFPVEAGSMTTKAMASFQAAEALVKACSMMSAVGAVAFSDAIPVHEVADISHDREGLVAAIRGFMKYQGGTVFYTALDAAEEAIEKFGGTEVKRMILLTDGQDWPEFRPQLLTRLDRFREKKIIIDCVAFGADADHAYLKMISDRTSGVVKGASDAAALVKAFLSLEAGTRGLLGKGKP